MPSVSMLDESLNAFIPQYKKLADAVEKTLHFVSLKNVLGDNNSTAVLEAMGRVKLALRTFLEKFPLDRQKVCCSLLSTRMSL